jgi:hypothetical protein
MSKTKRKFIIKVEFDELGRQPEYVKCRTRLEAQTYIKNAIKPVAGIKFYEIQEV